MNKWRNTYIQTFRDLNENQMEGLCDFPQREPIPPKPSCQKQLTSAHSRTTMLNYCLTTSHMMISCISPGKSSPFSQCWEQLQFTRLGRLFNTIPSNKSELDFSGSLSFSLWRAPSRSLTCKVHGSGKRFTISQPDLKEQRKRKVGPGCDPSQRKDSGVLFQITPGTLDFEQRRLREWAVSSVFKADTSVAASFCLSVEGSSWSWLKWQLGCTRPGWWWAGNQVPEAVWVGLPPKIQDTHLYLNFR